MWVLLAWIRGPHSRAISKWVPCAGPSGVMLVGVRGCLGWQVPLLLLGSSTW